MNIYSKVDPKIKTHQVIREKEKEGESGDSNFVSADESLQVSRKSWEVGYWNPAHIHIRTIREMPYAQEAWVVMKGNVKARLFDIDSSFMMEIYAEEGDVILTFRGGHSYTMFPKGSYVLEFKTGPYWGKNRDKHVIGEPEAPVEEGWATDERV